METFRNKVSSSSVQKNTCYSFDLRNLKVIYILKYQYHQQNEKKKKTNKGKEGKPNQDIGWCGSNGHSWPPKNEWCDHSSQWQVSPLVGSFYNTAFLLLFLLPLSTNIYLSTKIKTKCYWIE